MQRLIFWAETADLACFVVIMHKKAGFELYNVPILQSFLQ